MELSICTDVFAELTYPEMLDKVKSFGIDAVEMTAGGWGARAHCPAGELLASVEKRAEYMGELAKRGMRISAGSMPSPCGTACVWRSFWE